MNEVIEMYRTNEMVPASGVNVLVAGGIAFRRDNKWFSIMSDPKGTAMAWVPTWWAKIPTSNQ